MNLQRIVGPDPWSIKADERQLNNIVTALMDLGSARPMSDCIFICMRVRGVRPGAQATSYKLDRLQATWYRNL